MHRILLFVVLTVNSAFSQNFGWITPNKTYLKLYTVDDAIYRINKNDFQQAGVNTTSIDPRTFKIYNKSSQIAIYVDGEQDGVFNENDFIDFYGTRNYGGLTPTYKDSIGKYVIHYITNEYFNLYSDTNAYWIGWDGQLGLRIGVSSYSISNPYPYNFHYGIVHIENDLFYTLGETTNPNLDFRYFNNEKVSGEGWFWQRLFKNQQLSQSFSIPDLLPNIVQDAKIRIFAYPNSRDTIYNEHRLLIKVNSQIVSILMRDDYTRFDTTISFSSLLLSQSTVNNIAIKDTSVNSPSVSPNADIDLIELIYPKKFMFVNNFCRVILSGSDTSSYKFSVSGYTNLNPVTIYDVKNNIKIHSTSSSADTLFFTGKANGNFEIINKTLEKKPFRFEARQVPDLLSATNGADYLLVYNSLFTSQAEELRSHRQQQDNYRSFKASIEDITDIFNYGIESPVALKNFITYVYNNWQLPKVSYVCLLGRGSLDPKNILNSPNYYKNFVPVYGNPPTDGYFASMHNGFTYYPDIAIGRLPVYTVTEAQTVVNKIKEYEAQRYNPEPWWKTQIMISGGRNRTEQIQYSMQSDIIINQYINPPPISGDPHRIYRNDSAGYVTYNYKDSIKNEFDRGGLLVNFIGHAAAQDWEVGLEDPNTLSNGAKLPLVLSMTCFTGKNSEVNTRSFGEKFIFLPNKGAIGFIGTTGWSYSGSGNTLNNYMFQAYAHNDLRRTGDILKFAHYKLSPDSISFATKHTINSYCLLGDPAAKLLLPTYPEFILTLSDYHISNPYPTIGENINVTIYPKNYGTFADSCKIRFQITKNGFNFSTRDTVIRAFAYKDTANYLFSLDTLGNYSLIITMDPDNWYPDEISSNNSITIQIPLRNISYVPLKPYHNSVLNSSLVEFVGLNPSLNPQQYNIRLILQVDTSKNFSSPLYTGVNSNISGVTTKFFYQLPYTDSNIIYYWRMNSVINNDSTGWSSVNKFVYRNVSFSRDDIAYDSTVSVFLKLPGHFENYAINNLNYTLNGWKLNNFIGNLFVKSYGTNGPEASYFIINNQTIYSDGGRNAGFNICKVSKLTGKLLHFRNFMLNSPQSSDSIVQVLNTFDTSHYLMANITSFWPPLDSIRTNAKNKIKQFGSRLIDSISQPIFNTWAFIGFLGASPEQISEQFSRTNPWTPSYASMQPVFQHIAGDISFSTGPAHRWKYFSWEQETPAYSQITFSVTGYDRSNQPILLFQNLTNNQFVNLDTLSAYTYPYMSLKANASIDSMLGSSSPLFKSVTMKLIPPAELIPDNNSFTRSDSVVQEGTDVTFSVKNYNVGYVEVNSYINKWSISSSGGYRIIKIDTLYSPLQADSFKVSQVTIPTLGIKDPSKLIDTIKVYFETYILGNVNEYFPYNNFALSSFVVFGDSASPSIDVTYDGIKINNGDLIKAAPEIVYKFFDNSQIDFTINDTASIFIKVDGKKIYYSNGNTQNPQINFNPVNEEELKVIINYNPVFSEGEHQLMYIAADQYGNYSDTLIHNIFVSYAFALRDLYNFPNPMKHDTYFTFNFYDDRNPDAPCRIKIYTVSGRLIKEIQSPVKIGFNQIYWDGRDNDGEHIANGIYLYKILLEGEGKLETSVQKLAILK